jgi:hypothetical protein
MLSPKANLEIEKERKRQYYEKNVVRVLSRKKIVYQTNNEAILAIRKKY